MVDGNGDGAVNRNEFTDALNECGSVRCAPGVEADLTVPKNCEPFEVAK